MIASPKGTFDILPIDSKERWKSSYCWQYIEQIAVEMAHLYGFTEMRTPIFEAIDLFVRSVGKTSDIVSKEMYEFEDRAGRKMVLRPEGTALV